MCNVVWLNISFFWSLGSNNMKAMGVSLPEWTLNLPPGGQSTKQKIHETIKSTCTNLHVHVQIYIHVQMYMYKSTCTNVHMYKSTCTCTCTCT